MAVLGRWTTTDPILMEQGPNKLLKDGKVQAFSMSGERYLQMLWIGAVLIVFG